MCIKLLLKKERMNSVIHVSLRKVLYLVSSLLLLWSCQSQKTSDLRPVIDLSGTWQFQLDSANAGIRQHWYAQVLSDSIKLPGSLDQNKKGIVNHDTTDLHLNRKYYYVGPAWFRKEIDIPESWKNKHVEFIMGRTRVTHVWLDSVDLGTSDIILSKQVYDLTGKLSPGKHTLTIMVNNDPKLVPVAGSHIYSPDTQTNWNGIIGKFCLEASSPLGIRQVEVYPNVKAKEADVRVEIRNPDHTLKHISVNLDAHSWNTKDQQQVPVKSYNVSFSSADTMVSLTYDMGDNVQLWSEFNPALYRMNVTLKDKGQPLDRQKVDFGMRDFTTKGTQFSINGLTIFLRGKHSGGVFPITGYPPMDTTGWLRVFRIAKSYGINHYRFHSWTPPAAAFEAADIAGIYMQPELPIWYGFDAKDSAQVAFMMRQGDHILDDDGNHASFVMFSLGNEIHQPRDVLHQMVSHLRGRDARHLYAEGSNDFLADPSLASGDDYWTTMRTGKEQADHSTDVRGSFSFADSKDGGIINGSYPNTMRNHVIAIKNVPVPVIGHEVGQYQVYPDFNHEMPKYTGVLKPWNFDLFKKDLKKKGMLDEDAAFHKASGALSVLCYREDIEEALRTPGFGGFQLLDLQDYPGQGTALVGILDAFMESKGLITPEEFREFNNDVVILANMKSYTWTNDETFKSRIEVANYGPSEISDKTVSWSLENVKDQKVIQSGKIEPEDIAQGGLTTVGTIEANLDNVSEAEKAMLKIRIDGTPFRTHYPVWIYPSKVNITPPADITVTHELSAGVIKKLTSGAKVLLFPDLKKVKDHSVGGLFITDFWNFKMFKPIAERMAKQPSPGTMGILTDPTDKIFNRFPTESHTNWQWWSILKNSRPIILDSTFAGYHPLVQVIDNIDRNHKLGLIFEYKVGMGKLLVCASNLPEIKDRPEARQLYVSILSYMESNSFNPESEISVQQLKRLIY